MAAGCDIASLAPGTMGNTELLSSKHSGVTLPGASSLNLKVRPPGV